VLQISELGLVEMTRKRVRQDLRSLLTTACPTCQGAGVTKTVATLTAEVFRALRARAAADARPELVVRVHPDLAAFLETEARSGLEKLAAALDRKITVQAVTGHAHRDEFEVLGR
jgi:ribonuclease G